MNPTPQNVRKHLIVICVILGFHRLHAQDTIVITDAFKIKKHKLHIEALGRTIIWGSVNYEYFIHWNTSIGGGFGISYFSNGDIYRDNNGISEKGRYLDISTSQMLYGNYFFGKRKHQFFLTGGITNFLDVYRRKYPSETKYSSESQIKWNAGIGYQYSCKKTYFRLTVYCIRMPDPSGWFPEIIPWAGVSVGVKL